MVVNAGSGTIYAQIPPSTCYYDPCDNVPWVPFTTSVQLPPFHCQFMVHMLYKHCPAPLNTDIFSLTLITEEHVCGDPLDDCAELYAWLNADDSRYKEIYNTALLKLATLNFPHNYLTNQRVWCPNGDDYSIHTYIAGCTKFCIYNDMRSIGSGGTGLSYIVPIDCGGGNCCKATYRLCYDVAHNEIVTTQTSEPIGIQTACPITPNTCSPVFTVQNPPAVGGTYDVPLSRSTGCSPNPCLP